MFSYDPSQLATSELYQVRLEISDVDEDTAFFQDEEIAWAISQETNHWGAAARCAEILSRRFLQQADVSLGRNLKIEYTKRSQGYADLAERLREKALGTVVPWAGGRSLSEKRDARADTDAVKPLFTKDGATNPRIGATDTIDSPRGL